MANIYQLTQTVMTGPNTYDSCIVVAETEEKARLVHPYGASDWEHYSGRWVDIDSISEIKVTELGVAKDTLKSGTVLSANYNGINPHSLKLYKLTQSVVTGEETFDTCVVVATSETRARNIHPGGVNGWQEDSYTWVERDDNWAIKITELGLAHDTLEGGTVICSSFNP